MSAAVDDYRLRKRQYESDYEQQVRKALTYVPGVTVSANVELEKELRREEKRVEIITQGGANQPANLNASLSQPNSRGEPIALSSDGAPAHNEITTESAGLTPKRVAISVGVPTSYFESVWRQRHSDRAGKAHATVPEAELARVQAEEIAHIRGAVAALLPAPDSSTNASELVTVTPFSHVISAEVPEPSLVQTALGWLANSWIPVSGICLAVAGLLLFRSMVRSMARAPGAAIALDATQFDEQRPFAPAGSMPRPEGRSVLNRSLREQLVDVVREDPVKAANILRTWIGNVN